MADTPAATLDHVPVRVIDYVCGSCPVPVVVLARAARRGPGEVVEVVSVDPAARVEVPA